MENNSMYYDYASIDSYNCLLNFIIGARGDGKTYGYKTRAIRRALEGKGEFLYLRRLEVEIKDSMNKFFKDISNLFPEWEFRIRNNTCQAREIVDEDEDAGGWIDIGYFVYLSNARRKKSVSYDGVVSICFDEFLLPQSSRQKYLDDEVNTFFEFYDTVARLRDVKVYFLGNALTTVNPYFLYFHLKVPQGLNGIKRISKDICIQLVQDEEYKEYRRNTRFGQLIEGTEYGEYATENRFVEETETFIAKKPQTSYYRGTIFIDDIAYAIYYDKRSASYFCSLNVNLEHPVMVTVSKKGRVANMRLLKKRYGMLHELIQALYNEKIYYENQRIKQDFEYLFMKVI